MWQKYFKLKKVKPGIIITHLAGKIDFSNPNLPIDTLMQLYENDFPYLEITPEGEKALYGIPEKTKTVLSPPKKKPPQKNKKPDSIPKASEPKEEDIKE